MKPFLIIGDLFPGTDCVYAGIVRGTNGIPDYHLLVPWHPGEYPPCLNWVDAVDFSSSRDEGLPTRREALIVVANVPELLGEHRYWTGDAAPSRPESPDLILWAWSGVTGECTPRSEFQELRVLTVKRIPITGEV